MIAQFPLSVQMLMKLFFYKFTTRNYQKKNTSSFFITYLLYKTLPICLPSGAIIYLSPGWECRGNFFLFFNYLALLCLHYTYFKTSFPPTSPESLNSTETTLKVSTGESWVSLQANQYLCKQ